MTEAAPITPVDVIEVNGHSFVSGLYWQTMLKVRSYEAEAKEIGKSIGMDIVTIRRTSMVIQAGFAPQGKGALKGMYSLAAALAHVLGDTWIGAFPVDVASDRYAFVAVLDGAIMPGREFIGTREDVEQALRETHSLVEGQRKKWERVIAPAEFEFGGKALSLVELLQPKQLKPSAKLKPLTFGMTKREILVAAGVIVGVSLMLGIGLFAKHTYDKRQDEARAAKAKKEMAALAATSAAKPAAIQAPVRTWTKQPTAIEASNACDKALGQLPLAVRSWVFDTATCGADGKVSAVYKQGNGGPLDVFLSAARERFGSSAALQIAQNYKSVTVFVSYPVARSSDDALLHEVDATTLFVSHFRGLDIEVAPVPVAPPPPPPEGTPAPPAPDWRVFTYSFDAKLPPSMTLAGMELNGLRLKSVDLKLTDGSTPEFTWTTTGELYVR
jgi:hypothetical protein